MKVNAVILIALALSTMSCSRNANPFAFTSDDRGKPALSIRTENNQYDWQRDESGLTLNLRAALENKSDVTVYSEIGDGFGPAEQGNLFVADNSAGDVEKFDAVNNSWVEVNIAGVLIEGSRFVPLQPGGAYSLTAFLTSNNDTTEVGTFRLRVNYFDSEEPENNETPFRAYSNTFEIE